MKITKDQLRRVIKEAIQEEMGSFDLEMTEDVVELLGIRHSVKLKDIPATLIAMAKYLQEK